MLADVEVVYETLPGWSAPITGARAFDELPENCRKYVAFIERALGVPVEWIGVGPGREAMIHREASAPAAAA